MPNWELRLIAQVLDTGDIKTAIREGINETTLRSQEAKALWTHITELYLSKGKVPSRTLVAETYAKIPLPEKVRDDLSILCDHVRKGYLSSRLQEFCLEISDLAVSSPEAAAARLGHANTVIMQAARVGEDTVLSESSAETQADYYLNKQLREGQKSPGVYYPPTWKPLNQESMGMLPEEFILLYGRPKSMKTFITCYIAAHAYFTYHKKVLFFTKEMSPKQIKGRVLCSIAEIDYGEYRRGELPEDDERKFFERVEGLREREQSSVTEFGMNKESGFVICSDNSPEGGGISSLRAMVERYQPDIVFVDGIYLMKDDRKGERGRDWKNIANITSDLKMLAQQFKIPVVGNSQANRQANDKRKGGDLRDIAFSDAAGQDADLIIRIDKVVDPEDEITVLNLVVSGSREFQLDGIVIHGQPCTNFEFIRLRRDKVDANQAKQDAQEESKAAAHKARLTRGDENKTFHTRPLSPEGRVSRSRRSKPVEEESEENKSSKVYRSRAHRNVREANEHTRSR